MIWLGTKIRERITDSIKKDYYNTTNKNNKLTFYGKKYSNERLASKIIVYTENEKIFYIK